MTIIATNTCGHYLHTYTPVSTMPPQTSPCPSYKELKFLWDTLKRLSLTKRHIVTHEWGIPDNKEMAFIWSHSATALIDDYWKCLFVPADLLSDGGSPFRPKPSSRATVYKKSSVFRRHMALVGRQYQVILKKKSIWRESISVLGW